MIQCWQVKQLGPVGTPPERLAGAVRQVHGRHQCPRRVPGDYHQQFPSNHKLQQGPRILFLPPLEAETANEEKYEGNKHFVIIKQERHKNSLKSFVTSKKLLKVTCPPGSDQSCVQLFAFNEREFGEGTDGSLHPPPHQARWSGGSLIRREASNSKCL